MSVTSETKRQENGIVSTIIVIIQALIIALVIRTFFFQPFNIPSGSMKATLLVGDYLFVSKYSYGYSHFSLPLSGLMSDDGSLLFFSSGVTFAAMIGWILGALILGLILYLLWKSRADVFGSVTAIVAWFVIIGALLGLGWYVDANVPNRVFASMPKRGDVVVFRLPKDTDVDYIKRVIGLPGDTVQVKDGQVFINGVGVKREPAPPYVEIEEGRVEAPVKRWKETLDSGVSHYTLDLVDNGFADNTQVYTVPDGHYFMMGDNRDNSTDSRFSQVGVVPFENIIGKAQIIFFSVYEGERAWTFWRWPVSVRWSRLFTIVR